MALPFRLRRALSLNYSLLHHSFHHHKSVPPLSSHIFSTPVSAFGSSAAVNHLSTQLTRPFTSTSTLFAKVFDPETDEIGPDTILFEGCDYEHWLITVDFPKDSQLTREQMIETYVNIASQVFGSVEEAKLKIYALSTTTYQGFQVVCSENTSNKFKEIPGVVFVLPDSYIDTVNKEYGGDKYINGEIIPRPPPVHYGRQNRDRRARQGYGWSQQQQNHGPPPPHSQNYGPQGQQNHGSPPQQNYAQPPHQNHSPPPQQNRVPMPQQNYRPYPQQNYGPANPQQNYGPPTLQQNYGPPTPQQNYGPPSPQQSYVPLNPQQSYGPPNPQQNFGPPNSQRSYGTPNAQQNYGPQHAQQNYGPQHPHQKYGPSNPQQNFGPLPHQNYASQRHQSFGDHPSPPPQQNYGPEGPGDQRSFQSPSNSNAYQEKYTQGHGDFQQKNFQSHVTPRQNGFSQDASSYESSCGGSFEQAPIGEPRNSFKEDN